MFVLWSKVSIVATSLLVSMTLARPVERATDPAPQYRIDTTKLPGLDSGLTALPQWSGYMPVGSGNSLFFWYTQAANASSDNLIFWHNGGPGCSSLEGLFEENGPYRSSDGGHTWTMNPDSWHNAGHVVYIDQPFGTGFSTDKTTVPSEDFIGDTMVQFYLSFFSAFPGMKDKNMYITGESYAGRYIPYMAKHVLDYNVQNPSNSINLKAVAIGNAYVDTSVSNDVINYLPYLQAHPWIVGNSQSWLTSAQSTVNKMKTTSNCANAQSDPTISSACKRLSNQFLSSMPNPVNYPLPSSCTYGGSPLYFDPYQISVTSCEQAKVDLLLTQASWEYFLNLASVQAQIHIGTTMSYSDCVSIGSGIYRSDPSVVPKYFLGSLIDRGLKVTLYSGLLDTVVPHTLTEAVISQITWGGVTGFASTTMTPIYPGNSSTKTGSYHSERGLSYVIIDNAGHMVPRDDAPTATWLVNALVNGSI
ncbi:Cell death protease [Entomortierella beljakovae]|nr:Cell death protease [Entomortierella beljakovae]